MRVTDKIGLTTSRSKRQIVGRTKYRTCLRGPGPYSEVSTGDKKIMGVPTEQRE